MTTTTLEKKILDRVVASTPIEPDHAKAFVDAVGADIIAATAAADNLAVHNLRCAATFIEDGRLRKMSIALGLDALDRLGEAAADAIKARRTTIAAELELYRAAKQIGVTSWGPWCPCDGDPHPANGPFRPLR